MPHSRSTERIYLELNLMSRIEHDERPEPRAGQEKTLGERIRASRMYRFYSCIHFLRTACYQPDARKQRREGVILVLLVFPWILTAVFTFGSIALGCYKRYNRFALIYTYSCSHCDVIPGISFTDVNFYGGQALPSIHGAIQQRQSLLDARLAFQFIVICLSQYLAALLFYIVPKMSAGADWGVLVTNSIGSF
ncbi:hypothetical protein RB195_014921 [Necator americanus]|uniref:Uncharacterized protein n=1 Tax=Necator americanus TaxID=51031 RepID=A0ABR1E2P3_NECAM